MRFVPREQVARPSSLAFGSILPWLSGFVFPCDGIPLASEYQSKQYHVARIRPSCHGKRARERLSLQRRFGRRRISRTTFSFYRKRERKKILTDVHRDCQRRRSTGQITLAQISRTAIKFYDRLRVTCLK